MLIQILLDPLRLAQEERRMIVGTFDELFQNLHRVAELLGKLCVFLILPSIA